MTSSDNEAEEHLSMINHVWYVVVISIKANMISASAASNSTQEKKLMKLIECCETARAWAKANKKHCLIKKSESDHETDFERVKVN